MKAARLVTGLIVIATLGGCATASFLQTARRGIFMDEDVNLMERNYAIADYLASITKASINRKTPILQKPLLHANNTGLTSAFGEAVTDQVGARLAQLGYNVIKADDTNAPNNAGDVVILGGTYLPGDIEANVALRLIEQSSNKILGSYDYIMPVNAEIAEMMEDQPAIFRLPANAQPLPME